MAVEHPLDKPSFVTAIALLSVWGVGAFVMQNVQPIFWLGAVVCVFASLGTVMRYGKGIAGALRGSAQTAIPRWEAAAVSVILAIELIGVTYFAFPVAKNDIAEVGEYLSPTPRPISLPKNPPPPQHSPLDDTILFDCIESRWPERIPANGLVSMSVSEDLQFNWTQGDQLPGEETPELLRKEERFATDLLHCTLKNFSSTGIANAAIKLDAQSYAPMGDDFRAPKQGNIVKDAILVLPNIRIKANDDFGFYVGNYSGNWLRIIPPKSAKLTIAGRDYPQDVKLIRGEKESFWLRPYKSTPSVPPNKRPHVSNRSTGTTPKSSMQKSVSPQVPGTPPVLSRPLVFAEVPLEIEKRDGSYILRRVSSLINNQGRSQIKWRIDAADIVADGVKLGYCEQGSWFYLGVDYSTSAFCDFAAKLVVVPPTTKKLVVEMRIEYDEIPPTGMRTSDIVYENRVLSLDANKFDAIVTNDSEN